MRINTKLLSHSGRNLLEVASGFIEDLLPFYEKPEKTGYLILFFNFSPGNMTFSG